MDISEIYHHTDLLTSTGKKTQQTHNQNLNAQGLGESSFISENGREGCFMWNNLFIQQPNFSTRNRWFCSIQQYLSPEITLLGHTSPGATRDTKEVLVKHLLHVPSSSPRSCPMGQSHHRAAVQQQQKHTILITWLRWDWRKKKEERKKEDRILE